jgi:hypothetical protein
VNGELLERLLALSALALVCILATLTFKAAGGDELLATPTTTSGTEQWQEATVGTFGPGLYGQTTVCGVVLEESLQGISHPVLPCGARILVEANGIQVDTAVVDKAGFAEGQEFALTEALAGALGVQGQATVRWRFSEGAR